MAAGFFLFKTLNLSVFRKGNQAAFAGTANPGNWTVAGACGPGAAGFFILNLKSYNDPERQPDRFRSVGSLSAGADESGTVGRADKPAQAGAQDRPVRAGFFYLNL